MKFSINKEIVIVVFVLLLAFLLRVYKINTDLLYHRDQGLVAMDIYKIWHDKEVSLLGAPTDVDGLYHSPVYYWILLPFYYLGRGDIVFPAVFQIVLEILSLPLLYLALKKLFNKGNAIFTLILYSVSYGLISYSRWFITVPFILPLTNFLLYLLVYKKDIFLSSLTVGMISQTNAAVGIFYLPFLIFHYRKELNIKNIAKMISGFIIPALPLIIFQFRHNFITFRTILNYLQNKDAGVGFNQLIFINNLKVFLNEINKILIFPYLLISTALFFLGLLNRRKDQRLIYSFLLIPFLFLGFFQRGAISFFFIAALPISLALMISGVQKFPAYLKYVLVLFIIVSNIAQLNNIYEPNNALIPIGDSNVITLQDRKNIIDWMYQKADGKQFSIWIYTIPYYQDYPWEYLFLTYARDKFGYLPEAPGSFSKNDLKESKYFFDIFEIDHDNQDRQRYWFEEVSNNFGQSRDSYRSHDISVEVREEIN